MLFKKSGYRRKKLISVQKRQRRTKLTIALLTLVTIFATSTPNLHLDTEMGMEYTWWFDMIQHGGYYFLLGITTFLLFPEKKYFQVILFCLCLGSLVLEVLQAWIPGRTFTLLDITSNYLGITAATLVNIFILRPMRKRKQAKLAAQKARGTT